MDHACEGTYADLDVGDCVYDRPQSSKPSEADELLRNLGLNPVQFRTEGGVINHLKVKAAILRPDEYPKHLFGSPRGALRIGFGELHQLTPERILK